MKMKSVSTGLVALAISLGLFVLGAFLNVSAVTAFDGAGVIASNTPPADECKGTWEKATSHRSLVCTDGFWHNVDFEHWQCKAPGKVVDHHHRSRTQESCEKR